MTITAYFTLGVIFFGFGYTWGRIDNMLKETKTNNHTK